MPRKTSKPEPKQPPTKKAAPVPDHFYEGAREGMRQNMSLPHLSELAESFVREAGGPAAVAKMMFDEWRRADPGSLHRSRILQIITQVWKFGSEKQTVENLGLLSEEDLERELVRVMGDGYGKDSRSQEMGHSSSPEAETIIKIEVEGQAGDGRTAGEEAGEA